MYRCIAIVNSIIDCLNSSNDYTKVETFLQILWIQQYKTYSGNQHKRSANYSGGVIQLLEIRFYYQHQTLHIQAKIFSFNVDIYTFIRSIQL